MYYVLDGAEEPCRWMGDTPFFEDFSFWSGAVFTEKLSEPLEFTLEPYKKNWANSDFVPAFFSDNPPLFRDDLIEALREFGVTNFDTYQATLTDPDNGHVYENYKAVQIIGLVAAADMEKSDAIVHDNIPLIDVDFDKLVIDESKTHGLLMFRLAESTNTVLIHEKLRDYLIAKGFEKDMRFWDPEKIAI